MTNKDVVDAWYGGRVANSTNLITDGRDLYSYELRIGATAAHDKVAFKFTGAKMVSTTTSKHVSMAIDVADLVI